MHFRTLAIALAVLGLLAASPALAKSPHRYTLHGKHCKRGYRKARRPHKTFCIKQPKKKGAALAEKVKLHAHLDPSYTRDPRDPFKVTYAYSASATQEPVAAAASISSDSPAPLPSGVLALYSDGQLECAVNVGAGVESSECPVNYQVLGAHKVTTIYSSGEQSATATEIEVIDPLPSSTSLSVQYEEMPQSESTAKGWHVGTVVLTAVLSPSPAGTLPNFPTCTPTEEPACIPTPYMPFGLPHALFINGRAEVPVYQRGNPGEEEIEVDATPVGSSNGEVHWWPITDFTEGLHYLRIAPNFAPGYTGSTAAATLRFTPEVRP